MTFAVPNRVLIDTFGPKSGAALQLKQVALVLAGIAVLAIAAKIRVPTWPVPITMGTFAVLSLGAAYGARLGLVTILGYLIVGALGFDVFAGSSAEAHGLTYMMGSTGGYLAGYVLATWALGLLAARGWDSSFVSMALALMIGNTLIYLPGLAWLGYLHGWHQPVLQWGLLPFLPGDALKLALAALTILALWRLLGSPRS